MTNLDSLLKSRDIADKGPSSQSYGFSSSHVWMWELDYKESWEQKTDAFELWCWIRLLKVPWTARRSNQSIPKEISPEYSLEGLMLKLKLQYFATWCEELTHLTRLWCWERLKDREAWHAAVHVVAKSHTGLSDWTELNRYLIILQLWKCWVSFGVFET